MPTFTFPRTGLCDHDESILRSSPARPRDSDHRVRSARSYASRRTSARGYTLTEIMMTLIIVALVASLAFPAYRGQLERSRRAEAIAALLILQQAEEKWRGQHNAYADLQALAADASTANKLYTLDIQQVSATGYVIAARAVGAQSNDRGCAVLKLSVSGGQTIMSSGADDSASNLEAANKRCWNQ
jgi:type IV pilus assembly protein PilE